MPNPHLEVAVDRVKKLVRVRRTEVPLVSAGDIGDMVTHARAAMTRVVRPDYGLLVDLRPALLADESTYATDMAALRRELCRGFRRVALLCETPTGVLQVQRFIRVEKLGASAFDNEAKALVFLDQASRSAPPVSR